MFLTRRIRESLEAVEPVINPPDSNGQNESDGDIHTNGHSNSYANDGDGINGSESQPKQALIATASRGARTKIWNLYVSILNEIVQMGPEDGKEEFGADRWKLLVKHVREGAVWDEVINKGYRGVEGLVDADVVTNL